MSYSSYDPRKDIRKTIGQSWWTESDGDQYTINVTDNGGDTIKIPMYLAEEVNAESLSEMPYIIMNLALCNYEPEDIGARTRKAEAYIDISVEFTDTDNIDCTGFGKKVIDEIINQVRTHQVNCTFPATITFVNVESVKCLNENQAHKVYFKYIVTLYSLFYDLC